MQLTCCDSSAASNVLNHLHMVGGGPKWAENHIETYISMTVTYRTDVFRVGEMKDTVQINAANAYVRSARTGAPDDIPSTNHIHGDLIALRAPIPPPPGGYGGRLDPAYTVQRDEAILKVCIYGHGKYYKKPRQVTSLRIARIVTHTSTSTQRCGQSVPQCVDLSDGAYAAQTPFDIPFIRRGWIGAEYTNETLYLKICSGVKMGEADGTVSLVSLEAMCVEGWARKRWNPAGNKVTALDSYPEGQLPTRAIPSAWGRQHIDILRSTGLNEIILKVATGAGHEIMDSQTYASSRRARCTGINR
ncbi:LACT-domain-containing protein [Mycena sanguinolenta]|uniref:LACT-domain-containing protein n=1 Tax=Mycena sanguinolenta TaxID=230812 RepID=A0A8H6ZB80_9AGAR|nr:LACT-domain-containing protein [Mycena sanguinolenta]